MKYIHPKRFLRVTKEFVHDFFWYHLLPDGWYYRIKYKRETGRPLHLKHPHTLNEKMQWLKMYYRLPIMPLLADKFKVKEYIGQFIGKQYVIPTIGVWESFEQIDWNSLPDQFVLKCNHSSAANLFCSNKQNLDFRDAKRRFKRWMRNYYYDENKQWAYKDIKPLIMAEPYLKNADGTEIVDYKFYIYGGELMYFMFSLGEASHHVRNVKFSPQKELIDYHFKSECQLSMDEIKLPNNIDEMITLAQKVGKSFRHLRLDMFSIEGRIYIGEFTFYSNGGFINIIDEDYSQMLADKIPTTKSFEQEMRLDLLSLQ